MGRRQRAIVSPRIYLDTVQFPGRRVNAVRGGYSHGGFSFPGGYRYCVMPWQGVQAGYYLGAKAVMVQNGLVRVVQGSLELEAELLERTGKPLKAPTRGDMARTIHESVACRASYRFRKNNHTLLAFETDRASFEYEYPE